MPFSKPALILTHEFYPFRGGVARYVQELALEAHNKGIPLEVCCQQPPSRAGAWPYIITSIPGKGTLRWSDTYRFIRFLRLHANALPDRIICLTSWGALRAWALSGLKPANSSIRILFHGSEILKINRRSWFWGPIMLSLFQQKQVSIFATTPFVRDLLLRSPYFPKDRSVEIAPCGLSHPFRNLPLKNATPTTKPPTEIIILSVARLDPRKGQLEAIKAMALLPSAIKYRITYRMIGRGSRSYRKKIFSLARRNKIRCVHIPDASDSTLIQEYQKAYLLIQPSLSLPHSIEGFGLSIIEAAACRCPAIAYASGGLVHAIEDGATGWLVPENNPTALSNAILEAIENPEERNRRAHLAHNRAIMLTYDTAVQRLLC
ncbi:MAG: glycosyltransferase family 4 protein [Methylacidiphilales bacterium]|nr:glycosyltransferase family 4 protein [Candidatus Methylacidiphilales bacterium]MDW8349428.1 glycosyltransferase family 4 protein [Verrucomicrobiae bacterium]